MLNRAPFTVCNTMQSGFRNTNVNKPLEHNHGYASALLEHHSPAINLYTFYKQEAAGAESAKHLSKNGLLSEGPIRCIIELKG